MQAPNSCGEKKHQSREWPRRERRQQDRFTKGYGDLHRHRYRLKMKQEYLKATVEERDKEYLQAFTRLLTSEDKTVLKQVKVSVEPEPTLKEKFGEHANKWERETRYVSSLSDKIMHPSYQAIIHMGVASPRLMLSLLLQDMQVTGRAWFTALARISKQNPVEQKDAGNVKKMTKAWLKWGKSEGLL